MDHCIYINYIRGCVQRLMLLLCACAHACDMSLEMNFMIMCFIHIRIGEKRLQCYIPNS